jgi:outer membrane protein assembly factor BamB
MNRLTAVAMVLVLPILVCAEDWPSLRGPHHSGKSGESLEVAKGLEQLWEAKVGGGHGSVSVSRGQAYTMGRPGDGKEWVYCFDAATGRQLWKFGYAIERTARDPVAQLGPACTPAIDGDSVYSLGQGGECYCLNANNGAVRWQKTFPWGRMARDIYGYTQSPVLVQDLVVLNIGNRGTALDKKSGAVKWGNEEGIGACCSAVPAWFKSSRFWVTLRTIDGRTS